jgi:predicted small integral membrane protein
MAVDFPASPTLNQTYTDSGRTWRWNGTGWQVQANVITGDIESTAVGYFELPTGTTAQRPVTPATGMVRFNTTRGCFEGYTGSAWVNISPLNIDDIGATA